MIRERPTSSLAAAILSGIGASLCCVAPPVLLALGIGEAWIGNLTALGPYRPPFIGITVLFFGVAPEALSCASSLCRRRLLFGLT